MTRAQETGSIISAFLPDVGIVSGIFLFLYINVFFQVPVYHCDLLREGAPIPPEPALGTYRPESQVI